MDYERVTATLGRLLRDASEDLPLGATLVRLCSAAVDLLGLDGAGVMVTRGGQNWFEQAVSEAARDLEKVQDVMRFGPCQDAAASGRTIVVGDAGQMRPWPMFAEVAAAHGITGLAAMPLLSRGRCWGVLDLYTSTDAFWNDEALAVAHMLADGATSLLTGAADRDAARLAQVQLAHQATHDDLTGLPNRMHLFDRLQELLDRCADTHDVVAVMMVDLHDFGHTNDVHGHRAGDHVLRETGLRLRQACAPGDIVARLGGDVFVLARLLESAGPGDEQVIRGLADQIDELVGEPIELEAGSATVVARIGVATCGHEMSAEDAVDEADNALYETLKPAAAPTKLHQKHSAPPRPTSPDAALTDALQRETLTVQYQPIVSAVTPHRVVATEALLRWTAPDGHVLPAQNFIQTAARHGLMPQFGRWLIDKVCAQMATWDAEFADATVPEVYINISARELNDPTLPGALSSALCRHGLTPDRLGLEIVEDALIHRGLIHRIDELRDRGHHIAVDDFGTGASTLSRLTELKVDVVKLDKTLTAIIARDAQRARFFNAAVDLAASINAIVVAEGVETTLQRDALANTQVDRFQGYLFGRPQTSAQWHERLQMDTDALHIEHLITGRTTTLLLADLHAVLSEWTAPSAPDIQQTIDALILDLAARKSTRKAQNFLGIQITRVTASD